MNNLTQLSLTEASQLLHKGEIRSVELTESYLAAITQLDSKLGCFLHLCPETALTQAKAADARLQAKKNLSPLTGIPIGLKDIFTTKNLPTTCASKILENYVAPYNATVTQKLEDAGAVLLGKLNMDEFAMGSTNEHSAFKPVHNPWDLSRIPGGSSGGSAAAVAANLCAATLGTDTGGSIRQPAAMCGVVGVKPTYGRVSRYGMIAFASSLDQAGPLTKTVSDAALMLQAICGRDEHDSTSLNLAVPNFSADLNKPLKGKKLGLPKEYFIDGIDAEVLSAIKAAVDHYRSLGAEIVDVSLPHTKYAVPTYYIIAPAEASANLARFDGIRYGKSARNGNDLVKLYEESRSQGFGPEVTLRIILGTYVLSSGYYDAYYLRAQKARQLIKQDFMNAFQKVDALITPTTPTAAFPLGNESDDPVTMYLNDIFTIPTSLAGLPGLALPCGFTKNKLPIGLQLIGKPLDEAGLLQFAHAYEQSTPWHKQSALPGGAS